MPKISPNLISMTPERRDLILKVVDDCMENVPICHQITSYRYCDNILKWLINHQFTGKKLRPWMRGQCSNSVMTMVSFIIAKNTKDKMRPILLGRDWIP